MKPFLVCIHDATPAYARETRAMLRDLAPLLGRRLSFAVVPDWHGEWPLAAHPDYCRLVRESAEEILLHGYFHRRRRGWGPITFLAEGCDEMNGLDPEETRRTLERGQRVFAEVFGEPARGFLAPAWQPGHVRLGDGKALEGVWEVPGHLEEVRACSLGRKPQVPGTPNSQAAPEGRRQFPPRGGLPSPLRGSMGEHGTWTWGSRPRLHAVSPPGFPDTLLELEHVLGFFSLESAAGRRVPLATFTWDCGRWGWLGHLGHGIGWLLQSLNRVPALAIHPRDLQRGFWPKILRLIRELREAGYEPSTPEGLLEARAS